MLNMLARLCFLVLTVTVMLLPGCTQKQVSSEATNISGTAFYRERMALPAQAKLRLILYRVDSDGSRKEVTRNISRIQRQIPLSFELKTTLSSAVTCELEASILAGDEVLFQTPAPVTVHPGDNDIHLLLQRFFPEQPSGTAYPSVSREGNITDRRWTLSTLNGKQAEVFPSQPEVHLLLTREKDGAIRVSGSDGCNRLIGSCKLAEDAISFSQMGSTMMLCPAGEEQARNFAQSLSKVTHWRFVNKEETLLELSDGDSLRIILKAD